ncbi:FAD-dependent oxidoreductase [Neoactinobaculum massilliense]|uniref:FAD-dependent oxidoreductase n=1 Tax=Neoactinobaculum massilliense TaxID=2364794 RepID=UPI000F539683|nr:FAD-dependent oxidoreductase [Neoactinobaculum massilliense]
MDLDVLVIGFGKAGKTLAMKRGAAGDRVAIVEQSPAMYGGTCINIACVPTKRLLTEALRGTDWVTAREGRNAFIDKLNAVNKKMALDKNVAVIDGHAEFTGPHSVRVTGGTDTLDITASTIIINTGALPNKLDVPGADAAFVYDSTTIQQVKAAPQNLVIVGGGPIGLEFATMFNGFGSHVTVLDAGEQLLPRYGADIRTGVEEELARVGITVVHGARVKAIEEGAVRYLVAGAEHTVPATAVLAAIGRHPATDGLGLEAAGIKVTERGAIAVDEHMRTNVEGVYAAGDVTGHAQFTYASYDDFRIIRSDRWGEGTRTASGRLLPVTTFINPPLASVGMNEEEAREEAEEKGYELKVAAADVAAMAIVPRPKILGMPQGRAKILVDATHDRILGATLWMTDAQELINTVALAMREGVPASHLGSGIYTHPASSEVFNALLEN